jgi:hypothetical protein
LHLKIPAFIETFDPVPLRGSNSITRLFQFSDLPAHHHQSVRSKMADALVENPVNTVPPHKKGLQADAMPEIDSFEGVGADGEDEYSTLKRLQRHLE